MNARRVLMVDDDRDMADSLSTLLELEGYEVRTVYDGESAITAAMHFQPHVALLDLGLPDMTGHAVGIRIRTLPGCAATVLIALTGWGKREDMQHSREIGFMYHLVKPVDPNDLIDLLATIDTE